LDLPPELDRPQIVADLISNLPIFVTLSCVVDILYSSLDFRVRLGEKGR
jgi:ABC-type dipeptide/oligopeptide/nickel transport system permease component